MAGNIAEHLKTGATTLCRAWKVERSDGVVLGFTDHDEELHIEGVIYSARSGLTARYLQQSTGLAVDNTEAMGALSDASVREEDILAGRYDGAEVTAYLVNWRDVRDYEILFRGSFGEVTRSNGAFSVELRGLAEKLNIPTGRVYQPACDASLGDARCGVDITLAEMQAVATVEQVLDGHTLVLQVAGAFSAGWFEHGVLTVSTGAAAGLMREIRADTVEGEARKVSFWHDLGMAPKTGDQVLLVTGCDKRSTTCAQKFQNILNFRGFPHIPGDDWLRRPPQPGQIRQSNAPFFPGFFQP